MCSMCSVHSHKIVTYVETAFLLCDTFSTHLYPVRSNSSSKHRDANGLCMNELIS